MLGRMQEWADPGWRAAAVDWMDACLPWPRTGEVTQPLVRRWGSVLTAPTAGGRVWLKATAGETAHELALYRVFAAAAPDHVPTVIALDPERGWLLLRDHAPALADPRAPLPAAVLVRHAQLQRSVTPHAAALVTDGVPDMRPAVMPQRFAEAVDAVSRFVARHGDAVDSAVVDAVRARRAEFEGWCAALAESPVPASVDHNDLHAGNVLVGGGAVRFFDWGDAVIAHPFAVLLVPLQMAGEQGPRLQAAYLRAFADLAPMERLVADAELACRVAVIARVLTWVRAVGVDGEDLRFARAPLEALAALLEVPPTASGTTEG